MLFFKADNQLAHWTSLWLFNQVFICNLASYKDHNILHYFFSVFW